MSNETENHELKFGFGQATLELNSVFNIAEGVAVKDCTHRAVKLRSRVQWRVVQYVYPSFRDKKNYGYCVRFSIKIMKPLLFWANGVTIVSKNSFMFNLPSGNTSVAEANRGKQRLKWVKQP